MGGQNYALFLGCPACHGPSCSKDTKGHHNFDILTICGLPKIMDVFLGVPIIRIVVWGPPVLGQPSFLGDYQIYQMLSYSLNSYL